MKKKPSIFLFIFMFILTGCTKSVWQTIDMPNYSSIAQSPNPDYMGDVPYTMRNWHIVADVSDQWFNCNYGLLLEHTKLSIDLQNRIWIYGPDIFNGPVGGMPDNPGCKDDNSPRIVMYDQSKKQLTTIQPLQVENAELLSASGWIHLDNNRILLNSVFIYKEPWDGEDGGKENHIYDIAILDQVGFQDVLSESGSVVSVPDFVVENNKVFAIFNSVNDPNPKIDVFDLDTKKIIKSKALIDCDTPKSIAVSDKNIFLLCQEKPHIYSLYIYSSGDFTEIAVWKDKILFTPNLVNNGNGFPMAVDSRGRVWVGYSYILEKLNGQWNLTSIFPDQKMIEVNDGIFYPKAIYAMEPYKNGMLFSIENGLFYCDIDKNQWKELIHDLPALPIVVGSDGRIYAFTGRFIISTIL